MLDQQRSDQRFGHHAFVTNADAGKELIVNGVIHQYDDTDALRAPLLSFILVNRNYADYVGQTLRSVRMQNYPNIECVIVDNGSTDESVAVIKNEIGSDARFRMIELSENIGQLGAAMLAFEHIKGAFVSFIDSDDVLFPSYASSHIQVHLALPASVGFTSSGAVEINQHNEILNSRWARLTTRGKSLRFGLLPIENIARLGNISDQDYESLSRNTALIPRQTEGWHWSPGSANMFRTSIIKFLKQYFQNIDGQRATDGFLNYLVHAITGSATVNIPLSAYRIHGHNFFARRESLSDLPSGEEHFHAQSRGHRDQSVAILLAGLEQFCWMLNNDIWKVIETAVNASDTRRGQKFYQSEAIIHQIRTNAYRLRRRLGTLIFIRDVFIRFRMRAAISILLASLRCRT